MRKRGRQHDQGIAEEAICARMSDCAHRDPPIGSTNELKWANTPLFGLANGRSCSAFVRHAWTVRDLSDIKVFTMVNLFPDADTRYAGRSVRTVS